jgi:hypothetical protein
MIMLKKKSCDALNAVRKNNISVEIEPHHENTLIREIVLVNNSALHLPLGSNLNLKTNKVSLPKQKLKPFEKIIKKNAHEKLYAVKTDCC